MAYIEQKNRLAPTWEQAFKNCIEFMSNLLGLSWLELGDVELYIQNVDLFMLIHWTHNSEKGEKESSSIIDGSINGNSLHDRLWKR